MEKEVKEFLKLVLKNVYSLQDVQKIAKRLLEEDFKQEVRKLWKYDLINKYLPDNAKEKRKVYKNISKINFINEIRYDSEKEKFINEHWEQIDDILKIIREYIVEIEKEKKETSENE